MTKDKDSDDVKIPLPDYAQHKQHPFSNEKNHKKLLEYLKRRIDSGMKIRDLELPRYARIDKQIVGWMKMSEEDRKAAEKESKTGNPTPKKMNIPLMLIHCDDLTTYFLHMFAPITGMFTIGGDYKEQELGKAITKVMDADASWDSYFTAFNRGLFGATKYNHAGWHCYWDNELGNGLSTGPDGTLQANEIEIWAGNRVDALCPYNTFWDTNVQDPMRVCTDAEYGGYASRVSRFSIQRATEQGRYGNTHEYYEDEYDCDDAGATNQTDAAYYVDPVVYIGANVNNPSPTGTDGQSVNWGEFFGAPDELTRINGVEVVTMYAWLRPVDFGLITARGMTAQEKLKRELWRFRIAGGKTIIETARMNNMHRMIPMFFCRPIDDESRNVQRSTAEILDPFQVFISFLFNTHVSGRRKGIHGVTYYDPTAVDMEAIPKGEVAARVPIKPSAYGRDVRTFLFTDTSTPGTERSMQDVDNVINLVQNFMPTQANPAQIAGIDRAVKSQVATVRQGANRRTHKQARLIDAQAMSRMRIAMYYNILQYRQQDVEVGDKQYSMTKLRNMNLAALLGQGLKALDRETTAENAKEIIMMILQNQKATQDFDVPGLINAVSDYLEMELDFTQFRAQQPVEGNQNVNAATDTGAAGAPAEGAANTPQQ